MLKSSAWDSLPLASFHDNIVSSSFTAALHSLMLSSPCLISKCRNTPALLLCPFLFLQPSPPSAYIILHGFKYHLQVNDSNSHLRPWPICWALTYMPNNLRVISIWMSHKHPITKALDFPFHLQSPFPYKSPLPTSPISANDTTVTTC